MSYGTAFNWRIQDHSLVEGKEGKNQNEKEKEKEQVKEQEKGQEKEQERET